MLMQVIIILGLLIFGKNSARAQLQANFTAAQVSGCSPLVVNFQDQSAGNPNFWKWDLGNNTISYLQNPIATYFNPGTYAVKLIVKNTANAIDSIVKSQYITIYESPTVNFNVSNTTGCYPLNVQFSDNSSAGSGSISNWLWDFSDGTTSTSQNPNHTYNNAGTFTISLRVTNSKGCSKFLSKPSFVNISSGVTADFSYSLSSVCQPPTTVSFINQSTGSGVLTYQWTFGNGNTSLAVDPSQTYTTAGTYTVKLIAKSSMGCSDTITKQNVVIGGGQANFSASTFGCAGKPISLSNTSFPTSISSTWKFSDGTSSIQSNPSKIFAAPGTYSIKLINDFGGCVDSITKTITILGKPTAAFSSASNVGCTTPHSVSFTNNSGNVISYLWNFGDGKTSTDNNPTHIYTSNGNYSVTLIVTNAGGCIDSLTKTSFVKIVPVKIDSISNLNVKGCLPLSINPIPHFNATQIISSYSWNFGDGGISIQSNPIYTYNSEGKFDVKLIIQTNYGCRDTLTLLESVWAGVKPTAEFGASPKISCANDPIRFSDSTTGGSSYEWLWHFGDGVTSRNQNPTNYYQDTGWFKVELKVWNYGCLDSLIKPNFIYINPPVAKFKYYKTCENRLSVRFENKSINGLNPVWDFGDGTTSNEVNPVHVFPKSGYYNVTLSISNNTCVDGLTYIVRVIEEKGSLNIADTVSCRLSRVNFNITNVDLDHIDSITWFFQELGGYSIPIKVKNANMAYGEAGLYNPAVIIKDSLGCIDTIKSIYPLRIYGPTAKFKTLKEGACLNEIVQFTDESLNDGVHSITNWQWNFGDNQTITYTSALSSHSYQSTGTYNIALKITDSFGCTDSINKLQIITVTQPSAAFNVTDSIMCPNTTINFNNTSSGLNLQYFWNFGEGTISTQENPSHSFSQQGDYSVRMKVTDKYSCYDSTVLNYIRVYDPKANFQMSDSFSTCPPLLVSFTNTSTNYKEIKWDFGDGSFSHNAAPSKSFNYPGIYKVKLIVISNGGCIDTLTKTITVNGPTGSFTYNPLQECNNAIVQFQSVTQNTVKYIWDFNDGNVNQNASGTASHFYNTAGIYLPKIILEDASGCKVPIVGTDTIKINSIETHIKAVNTILCDSGFVSFADSSLSNSIISNYKWNFGDGATSTQKNPIHYYNVSGQYNIQLITYTESGCSDTALIQNLVSVSKAPIVNIIGGTNVCESAITQFSGVVLNNVQTNWEWDFGNGQTANQQNPQAQLYNQPGTYIIQTKATNNLGCTTIFNKQIIVHAKPIVDAGVDSVICRFSNLQLSATGASSYTWESNNLLSCTTCPNPTVSPDSLTVFRVTGKSIFGCVNNDSITIRVKQPFKLRVNKNDTLCIGETMNLKASGAEKYQWSPSIWIDNVNSASPKAKPDSSILYRVIGKDDRNCFQDTGFVAIKVYPKSKIKVELGNINTVNIGSNIKLSTTSSADVTEWRWSPPRWLSCNNCAEPIATPKETITYSVIASNPGGCVSDREEVTLNVICNGANVFIPNTFSPNNDGNNDLFYPRGKGVFSIKNLKIINRWGEVVFEKFNFNPNDANAGWDGTYKGQKLQSDVFVYIADVVCDNNIHFPLKGNLTLIR